MNKNIVIRLEKKEEYYEVENLVRESFSNVYRPGCLEHYVLSQLRNDADFVPKLDFVMLLDGQIFLRGFTPASMQHAAAPQFRFQYNRHSSRGDPPDHPAESP